MYKYTLLHVYTLLTKYRISPRSPVQCAYSYSPITRTKIVNYKSDCHYQTTVSLKRYLKKGKSNPSCFKCGRKRGRKKKPLAFLNNFLCIECMPNIHFDEIRTKKEFEEYSRVYLVFLSQNLLN